MSGPVRLTAEHAEMLIALESAFPETMHLGAEEIVRRLEELDRSGRSLSWIQVRKNECLAYLVAWPAPSQLDVPQPDTVILVDDLYVRPGHSPELIRLLEALSEDIRGQGLQDLSLEGACRREAWRVFQGHQATIARLGYRLVGRHEYRDDELGEVLCWMRWDPIHLLDAEGPAAPVDVWEEGADPAPVPRRSGGRLTGFIP